MQGIDDASNRAWASVEMGKLDRPTPAGADWMEK
jgi:hypothetical protein